MAVTYPLSVHIKVKDIQVGELEGYPLLLALPRRHFHQKEGRKVCLLLLLLLSQVEWNLRKISALTSRPCDI